MKQSEIIFYFTNMQNMHLISGRGDFAVSPDKGALRRIFLADIKKRLAGNMLLGVIGLQIDSAEESQGCPLELSAYLTNFDQFMYPPILENESVAKDWICLIADTLLSFPTTVDGIDKAFRDGKVGNLPLEPFLLSSPDQFRFFERVRSARYG